MHNVKDILTAEEIQRDLKTKILGKRIFSFRKLDSTMDTARRLACEGCPEGTLIIAEKQIHGRGRLKRKWFSPYRQGLYFSLILRPSIQLAHASLLTIVAATSVAEVIRKVSGLKALIKWPNDVIVNGKKISGVLTETSTHARGKLEFLVLGIGLNVNTAKKHLPAEATSILLEYNSSYKRKIKRFDRAKIVNQLLETLEKQYLIFKNRRYQRLIEHWQALSSILGVRVKITCQQNKFEGYVQNLDTQGALILRQDHGLNVRILAGDVVRLK